MKNSVFIIVVLFFTGYSKEIGPLLFNEIYPFNGKYGEWLELKNCSSSLINLNGWQISDISKTIVITYADIFLKPSEVVLLVRDSVYNINTSATVLICNDLVSLNNSEDSLKILLPYSKILSDQAYYNDSWFKEDEHSLKRYLFDDFALTSDFWISSTPSPGYQMNSELFDSEKGNRKTFSVVPQIITPNGDGKNEVIEICAIADAGEIIELSIYNFNGNVEFTKMMISGERFFWDGKDSDGDYIESGPIYIVCKYRDNTFKRKRAVLWR